MTKYVGQGEKGAWGGKKAVHVFYAFISSQAKPRRMPGEGWVKLQDCNWRRHVTPRSRALVTLRPFPEVTYLRARALAAAGASVRQLLWCHGAWRASKPELLSVIVYLYLPKQSCLEAELGIICTGRVWIIWAIGSYRPSSLNPSLTISRIALGYTNASIVI